VYHLEDDPMVTSTSREEVLPMISMEVFMNIIAMRRIGISIREIAKTLGIHRQTVKRHIEGNVFPQYRKRKRRASVLDPY